MLDASAHNYLSQDSPDVIRAISPCRGLRCGNVDGIAGFDQSDRTARRNRAWRPQLSGFLLELKGKNSGPICGEAHRTCGRLIATASAARTCASGAAAFAGLVTIPAKYRAIATRFERHCCWLTAAGTDHGCSLCRSRTVTGTSTTLVVLLCHTARLATLGCGVAAFLEERLISSGEGKILSTIAAS